MCPAYAVFTDSTEGAVAGACGIWQASLQQLEGLGASNRLLKCPQNADHAKFASTAGDASDSSQQRLFFGAYTPVTKALWKKRLEYLGVPKGGSLPPIVEKGAEPISVTYPFTTDTEFLEMVRPHVNA